MPFVVYKMACVLHHTGVHVIISLRARASIFADYVITTVLRDPVTDYKYCCDPATDYQNPPCPCDRNVTAVVALTTVSTGATTPCFNGATVAPSTSVVLLKTTAALLY